MAKKKKATKSAKLTNKDLPEFVYGGVEYNQLRFRKDPKEFLDLDFPAPMQLGVYKFVGFADLNVNVSVTHLGIKE